MSFHISCIYQPSVPCRCWAVAHKQLSAVACWPLRVILVMCRWWRCYHCYYILLTYRPGSQQWTLGTCWRWDTVLLSADWSLPAHFVDECRLESSPWCDMPHSPAVQHLVHSDDGSSTVNSTQYIDDVLKILMMEVVLSTVHNILTTFWKYTSVILDVFINSRLILSVAA